MPRHRSFKNELPWPERIVCTVVIAHVHRYERDAIKPKSFTLFRESSDSFWGIIALRQYISNSFQTLICYWSSGIAHIGCKHLIPTKMYFGITVLLPVSCLIKLRVVVDLFVWNLSTPLVSAGARIYCHLRQPVFSFCIGQYNLRWESSKLENTNRQ